MTRIGDFIRFKTMEDGRLKGKDVILPINNIGAISPLDGGGTGIITLDGSPFDCDHTLDEIANLLYRHFDASEK